MKYSTRRKSERKEEEYFLNLKKEGFVPSDKPSGVGKVVVTNALRHIDKASDNFIDAVLVMLDDTFPSVFKYEGPISDGVSTGQIGCYAGVFLRDESKIDREQVRDYWIKPLAEVGIVEKVILSTETRQFIIGHLKAKSPISGYRLESGFLKLLKNYSEEKAVEFFSGNQIAERLSLQQKAAEESLSTHGKGEHHDLIQASIKYYVPNFLEGFIPIYIDDSDGDRVSVEEAKLMKEYGVELTIDDPWPDVLLVSSCGNKLWFIEAVTSDGEVDLHKLGRLEGYAAKYSKGVAGMTTTYPDWKTASSRQGSYKNLAPNTYMWIAEDASRNFKVETIKDVK